jgi:hypothetical protein
VRKLHYLHTLCGRTVDLGSWVGAELRVEVGMGVRAWVGISLGSGG